MMRHTLRAIALSTCWCVLFGSALGAQTKDAPDTLLARSHVERIPIGSRVKVWTRDGERFKAVLFSTDGSGITVKPLTRVPEPSRRLPFDRIERIEGDQDVVSVGKYAGVGGGIGAAVVLILLAGL